MRGKTVELDVRDDIRRGREPFGRIMSAAQQLGPQDRLKLLAPFEPVPLYTFLGNLGLRPTARELTDGSWEILFQRGEAEAASPAAPHPRACSGGTVVECDVRGLEPPQPMLRILEALTALPNGGELRARLDRRPMHLYPELEARGFTAETIPANGGGFVIVIRHA
jgi:uncharacterized protein (DUF2249 family)